MKTSALCYKNWEALLCTTFPQTKLIHIYILHLDFLPISGFQVLPVKQEIWLGSIFTRPGVAGAVLQTALSFVNSLGNSSLVEISSEQLQTVQARPDQTRPDQTRPDQTRPDQNF